VGQEEEDISPVEIELIEEPANYVVIDELDEKPPN
jgi:hypothetical protein